MTDSAETRALDQAVIENKRLRSALADSQLEISLLAAKNLDLDSSRFFWQGVCFFLVIALIAAVVGFSVYVSNGGHAQ